MHSSDTVFVFMWSSERWTVHVRYVSMCVFVCATSRWCSRVVVENTHLDRCEPDRELQQITYSSSPQQQWE